MLINETAGQVLARRPRLCASFWSRGRGLMFQRRLAPDEALLFDEGRASIVGSSIHMLFVFFPIAVIWLDAERRVVDMQLARPFRPYYAPIRPARYFIEGAPALLSQVRIGDQLAWTVAEK